MVYMAYIESIVLGISLAAIPGPIFLEVARRTLIKGFWPGALLAVGEFLANFAILMITFLGVYQFLLYKPIKLFLLLAGSAVLLWIGYTAVKTKQKGVKFSKGHISGNSILVGFGLGISSPLHIAVWISVGGAYLAQYASQTVALINIVLLAFGVMIFFFFLAAAIHLARHKIEPRYIVLFSKLFGTLLIAYGIYFLYQFVSLVWNF